MAAKLQCEICGGKLIGKPGGVFECEYCGTEYSTEWAKAKIQEIKGTVKVEGTVEVKGSVQVEGTANAQSLVKRGNLALEDGKWNDAEKYFDEALNADPENAEAYLGIVMSKKQFHNKGDFTSAYVYGKDVITYRENKRELSVEKELDRAVQFAGDELKKWFAELEKQKEEYETRKEQERLDLIKQLEPIREQISKYRNIVSAGDDYTVGLKADRTVVALGEKDHIIYHGQCDVESWTDIMAVSAGYYHTVGLKADGTVVATNYIGDQKYYNGQCDVQNLKDIVAVSAGGHHTIGLKADGTVVAVCCSGDSQCDVKDWNDIVAVSAGCHHTVGLKADGTVIAVGDNGDFQCNVSDWTDIVAISAGLEHTVGLKSDGTVVAVGEEYGGKCNVSSWKYIVAISAGLKHTVGLKSDGTVVAVGNNDDGQCDVNDWTDIVAVSAGADHTLGLKADGTVVAVGDNSDGQCDVTGWKLFKTEEEKQADYAKACSLQESGEEQKLAEAIAIFRGLKDYQDSADRFGLCNQAYIKKQAEREHREREKKTAVLNSEKAALQTELANLKGIFSGKRRKQIEARLAEIESELKRM